MKNILLAVLIVITFSISFPYYRDGNVFFGLLAVFIGSLAMYGVMIHRARDINIRKG